MGKKDPEWMKEIVCGLPEVKKGHAVEGGHETHMK